MKILLKSSRIGKNGWISKTADSWRTAGQSTDEVCTHSYKKLKWDMKHIRCCGPGIPEYPNLASDHRQSQGDTYILTMAKKNRHFERWMITRPPTSHSVHGGHEDTPCPSQPWWYWQRTSGEPEPLPRPPSSNEESLLPSSNRCLVKNVDSTMAWQEWDSTPSLWWCILRKGLLNTNFIKDPESHNTIPKQIRVFIFLQVGSSELTLALPYHQGFMELTVQWGDRF